MSHLKLGNKKKGGGEVWRCDCSAVAARFRPFLSSFFFTFSSKGLTGGVGVTAERAEGDISLQQKLNASVFSALPKRRPADPPSLPLSPPPPPPLPIFKNQTQQIGSLHVAEAVVFRSFSAIKCCECFFLPDFSKGRIYPGIVLAAFFAADFVFCFFFPFVIIYIYIYLLALCGRGGGEQIDSSHFVYFGCL